MSEGVTVLVQEETTTLWRHAAPARKSKRVENAAPKIRPCASGAFCALAAKRCHDRQDPFLPLLQAFQSHTFHIWYHLKPITSHLPHVLLDSVFVDVLGLLSCMQ